MINWQTPGKLGELLVDCTKSTDQAGPLVGNHSHDCLYNGMKKKAGIYPYPPRHSIPYLRTARINDPESLSAQPLTITNKQNAYLPPPSAEIVADPCPSGACACNAPRISSQGSTTRRLFLAPRPTTPFIPAAPPRIPPPRLRLLPPE